MPVGFMVVIGSECGDWYSGLGVCCTEGRGIALGIQMGQASQHFHCGATSYMTWKIDNLVSVP